MSEIDNLVIRCVTIPIIGTLLITNTWLLIMWAHDLIHFFSDSVAQCINQYHYNMIVYGASLNMLFSCIFIKNMKGTIRACTNMINHKYDMKPYSHLLLNMMMIQLAGGFIDSTIYQIIKNKYDQNNCDQIYSSFFVNHEVLHGINVTSMCIYFGVFVMIISAFILAFLMILTDHVNSKALVTV